MAKDTLTLELEGDIGLGDFARAMQRFSALVNALSQEVSAEASIEWVIQELYTGSAAATVQGTCDTEGVVDKVVDAFADVGNALAIGEEIPFSYDVKSRANGLVGILNGRVNYMRFITDDRDAIIAKKTPDGVAPRPVRYAFGTVKGTVQTLSMRRRLTLTVYDALFDRPVQCFLKEGQEETMRDAWGRSAVVSGRIGREPEHGRPLVVSDVDDVTVLESVEPGTYTQARGVVAWEVGDEPPEVIIRGLREEDASPTSAQDGAGNAQ